MADPSSHRRTRSAMVNLMSGGSSSMSSSASQIPPPSPRHSVHGSVLSSSQSSSQHLAPTSDNAKKPRVSTGSRSVASDMKSDSNGSSTSLPTSSQGVGSSGQSIQKNEGRSVEETVKVFRLYEALKSGDTAFISKTLRGPLDKGSSEVSTAARNQILHLAIQCAELPVIEYILLHTSPTPPSSTSQSTLPYLDINTRDPATGNTPLHVATQLARQDVIGVLLSQPTINDSVPNFQGKTPLDLARSPSVFEKLELAKSVFVEGATKRLLDLIARREYEEIEKLLDGERTKGWVDVNAIDVSPSDFNSDRPQSGSGKELNRRLSKITSKEGQNSTTELVGGSTLLHEAARNKDIQLIQILLLHGADPFRRDKKGKLPQDITKDDKIKAVLKKSPAAAHAQRGIEEKAILGAQGAVGIEVIGEQGREMKGYLKKWTNYTGGWKLRWFVLEDGVLSYYKHQDDIGSACRGAINMRIASLHMDPQDKQRFEILGKNSVKYHLKANHVVEAKRWYWTLNNAIQWAKDEAREAERRKDAEAERMGKLKELTIQQQHQQQQNQRNASSADLAEPTIGQSTRSSSIVDLGAAASEVLHPEARPRDKEVTKIIREEDSDSEDDDNDADSETNSRKEPPTSDALALAANSARLQLDLLAQVCLALQFQRQEDPNTTLGDATVSAALEGYDGAVKSLKKLIGDILKMTKERERYWKYRVGKEQDLRRLWEENMQRLAEEHEALQGEVGMERGKRKKTKRVLKQVLRQEHTLGSGPASAGLPEYEEGENFDTSAEVPEVKEVSQALSGSDFDSYGAAQDKRRSIQSLKSKSMALALDSSSSDDDDEEFFDAVDAGEVEVQMQMPKSPPPEPAQEFDLDIREHKRQTIESSMIGYEKPPRQRLDMDSDDRPKISLWGILKSMIGKDMTKMTLPVSFNECTSLLQRVAEDMEYVDLLDIAADRQDSTERMVYVAAFAASEYSSTINRIAKPFNPLLGETYEYCRPDKGYRFFVEQVSHHPPIGAAWAESPKWDYWGESAVKSKFYGKSFDINPLGTWFLKLRPGGKEELYTWKKVTTSVVGIITGSPTVDNYGLMEIINHNTGDKCLLDFKQRGWTVSTAYQVKGKVLDAQGQHVWSIGGRWNDKIYARKSTGSNDTGEIAAPGTSTFKNQSTFLIWESNPRPNMPFNLTQFAVTLNELHENLKPVLCPTDTRLRPDQRAMEDGKYDTAADEKLRLEEKQRAKRRKREEDGEEYEPRWFRKRRCEVTGEEYWEFTHEYWEMRKQVANGGAWKRVEDIF